MFIAYLRNSYSKKKIINSGILEVHDREEEEVVHLSKNILHRIPVDLTFTLRL